MKNQPSNDGHVDDILNDATFLYRRLTVALTAAIERMDMTPGEPNAVVKEADVREHFKALHRIIDIEADLVKRSKSAESAFGGGELDLEAAREEIGSRLSKLASSRRD